MMAGAFAGALIVLTQRFHCRLTDDGMAGVQKSHLRPTPRVGGLALMAGAVIGGLFMPPEIQPLWWLICLAAIPAFVSGFIEDITKTVSVRARLAATILSGLIFVTISGLAVQPPGIVGIDALMRIPVLSVLITAVVIGGIANAVNIIDGFHGLAAGTAIIAMASFCIIALAVDDTVMAGLSLVTIALLVGFLVLNFPFGLLFLGDAGAYLVGFLLASMAVALQARNSDVLPLTTLLVLAYPVTETLASIWRRLWRKGAKVGAPDRLHLHSLVHRDLARRLARRLGLPSFRNAATSVVLWIMPLTAGGFGLLSHRVPELSIVLLVCFVLFYIAVYRSVALMNNKPTLPTPRILLPPRPSEAGL